jgi:phosphate/sulfate permease
MGFTGYAVIVVVLVVMAVFDLTVGVANDAINFLNSALGSKIASRKVILTVASVGILVGTFTSTGMMEVARNGVFYPAEFSFPEMMMLFLGMIVGDILLLNIFNSLGLPTSTTVSMVFGLLGAAVGVSLHRISLDPDLSLSDLSQFLNSGKAMTIIGNILLSVVLAFIFGSILMFLSRLIFSFSYKKVFSKIGFLWCGISFAGIIYFALFKGLKTSGLIPDEIITFITDNTWISMLMIWIASSLFLLSLQRLKVNITKVTILAGTFALALAFAGNDLVNFIGAPMAGYDSFKIAKAAGSTSIMMGALSEPVKVNVLVMGGAGVVMVLTLFFNRKAMKVSQTELSLSSQYEGDEHFGSSYLSRGIVRAAVRVNNWYAKIVPVSVQAAIDSRFRPLPASERTDAMYDPIRAVVNLTAASVLISIATSMKLPLSTTYVVFMVAMGSSLADRAWGRESAVYRISGVFTVIAGWFITAFAAFVMSLTTSSIIIWGGIAGIVLVAGVCISVMLKDFIDGIKNKKPIDAELQNEHGEDFSADDILLSCTQEVVDTMEQINRIYNRTMVAVFKENRKILKTMNDESKALMEQARVRKYNVFTTLRRLQNYNINSGHFYVQVVDYLSEVTKALYHIVQPCLEHIDNNHEGLSKEQIADLMRVNDAVEDIFRRITDMMKSKDFSHIDDVMDMRDSLFNLIAEVTKNQLQRINDDQGNCPTRASLLYLDILSETKTMVLQARNLIKSQHYFIEHRDD